MKRYSPEELAEVLRLHKLWLNDEDGGERANLGGAYLDGANLDGANLYGANLGGANLGGADLGDNVVIQIGPLGSRNDYLIVIHTKGKTEYRTGCWTGGVKQLRAKVEETHHDNNHAAEYLHAIELCEIMLANRISQEKAAGG